MIALLLVVALLALLYLYNQYTFRNVKKHYPPEGAFVTVQDVKLHYLSRGEGKPLVFLHGGVLNGHDFDEVIEIAAANGYRAIAFDRPGYGYSKRPGNVSVTPKLQAQLLHEALEALEIEKPILVAHSWSGVLALTYALEYSDDLSGVVTLGAAAYPEGYPAEKGDPISTIISTPLLGHIVLNTLLAVLGPLMVNNILKETFKPENFPKAYRQATLAYWFRPSQFRANREDVLAFVPASKEIMGRYKSIRTPFVVVVGDDDPFETKQHSFRLHAEIAGSTLIVLDNVAHMIPQNHPGAVMQAIKALQLM